MTVTKVKVKHIMNKSDLPACEYSVNPYTGCAHACKYCYACFMKRFTGHKEAWGDFVDIKYWEPICNTKFENKEVFIGSVTDPYQPIEEEYRRTRALLEELQGTGVKLSISTKSDLILRDIELLKTFPNARISWSINTLEEEFREDMDQAVSIERRIFAMQKFHQAGIRTTCFISPIFPGITDVKAIIQRIKNCCNLIWLENLNLRGAFKAVILQYIERKYPQLVPLYRQIYEKKDTTYWEQLDEELQDFTKELGLEYMTNEDDFLPPFEAPPVVVNLFYHNKIKKSARKKEE